MKKLLPGLVLSLAVWNGFSAPFQNLGFDDANTNRLFSSASGVLFGSADDLLPGWQIYLGSNRLDQVYLNGWSGFASVALLDRNASDPRPPVEGRFALGFYHFGLGPVGLLPTLRLTQAGDIPPEATLHFVSFGDTGGLRVRIDGSDLSLDYRERPPMLGQVAAYDVFANVSAYGGRMVELEFMSHAEYALIGLESIAFIPEPGTRRLLIIGLAMLCAGIRRTAWRSR